MQQFLDFAFENVNGIYVLSVFEPHRSWCAEYRLVFINIPEEVRMFLLQRKLN